MMTTMMEKTFNSIFNLNDSYSGLHALFRRCTTLKTKKEEAEVIEVYLSLLQKRLKDPVIRPNFIGHCLSFIVFCDVLGYPTEFAHIHAINLAQQNTIPEKKMGYTACCCLLREGHELCILLVNTLVRDLLNSNVAVISLALTALCSAPLPSDAIPTLLPALIDRLTHQTAYVRCRAVVAVHHLLKRYPDQCCQIVGNLVARLGDEDPHVVARVLATLPDVIRVSPESVAGLVFPLVAIQRQILGGRLPEDMVYKGLQAPWAQLNIIKVLPELALTEEDEGASKEVLLETLTQAAVKEGQAYDPLLRAALVSQALTALMSLEGPSEIGQTRAMAHVSMMLTSMSVDVKHEGLHLLSLILARHEAILTPKQREAVTASLDNDDITVRRRALALLVAGAGQNDVQTVCGHLYTHTSSADPHMKAWLLEQAMALITRFQSSVSSDWQLSALIKFMPLAEESDMRCTIMRSCQQLLQSDTLKPGTKVKLLSVLEQHVKAKQAPTCLLMLYVWILGQFPELCQQEEEKQNDALSRLVTLGSKVFCNSRQNSKELLRCVVQACAKACEHTKTNPPNELSEFLKEVQSIDPELEAASTELLNSLPYLKQLKEALVPTPPPLDCTLMALDHFVTQQLKNKKCKPYQPHLAAMLLQRRVKSPESIAKSLEILVQSLVLPQTPNVSNPASVPSEDSWSMKSSPDQIETTSPDMPVKTLIWGKQGRIDSTDTAPVASTTTLTIALGGTAQVTCNSSGGVTSEDPLGDLLR